MVFAFKSHDKNMNSNFGKEHMTGRHLAGGKHANLNSKFDVGMVHTTKRATRFQLLESSQQSAICRSSNMSLSLNSTFVGHVRRGMQTKRAVFLRQEKHCSQVFDHIATTVLKIQKHLHY